MLILSETNLQKNYFISDALSDLKKGIVAKQEGLITNPLRTVIDIPKYDGSAIYMPSANFSQAITSVKVVTIFPKNPMSGKPTTQGILVLSDATTGEHLCLMNASYLTRLRTGALSGLGTNKLARKNSKVLGIIGTGAMAFEQVLGVLEVREMEKIVLFNRTKEKAEIFKENLIDFGIKLQISIEEDVEKVMELSDVICCSTRSNDPVFNGSNVREGTHINGVGSYLPSMREIDLETVQKCSKIIVDDLEGVKEEAGELIYAEQNSKWSFKDIYAELSDIKMNDDLLRDNEEEITFFKSVGSAYFDLAVAIGIYKKATINGFGEKVII